MSTTPLSPAPVSHAARLRAFAADGERLPLRITGSCMVPSIDHGDVVLVEARRFCWPGDVIAIALPGGRVAVHRLLGYRPTRRGAVLVTMGDASSRADPLLPACEVVGRVVAVRRPSPGDANVPFDTPFEVDWRSRALALLRFGRLLSVGAARTLRRGVG